MSCIKKLQIDNIIYTANTDFRVALKCNRIAMDETIGDYERSLGIICTMFGSEALDKCKKNRTHFEKLLKWILNYLSCGKEIEESKEEPDMDFFEDMPLIEASFMSDFHIDLENEEMDWQKFNKLINGLSNSEMGNCCILNRIRNIRNMDTSKIKDVKEREKLEKAKKQFALKKHTTKKREFTEEQIKNMEEFHKQIGL